MRSIMLCEHANENPLTCKCDSECACKMTMCEGKTTERQENVPAGRPISPTNAKIAKRKAIHPAVFDAFNELIIQNMTAQGAATVFQEHVVALLVSRGHDKHEIFSRGWLDIEEAYRHEGWHVVYDKPGYNESGEAFFRFSIPRSVVPPPIDLP